MKLMNFCHKALFVSLFAIASSVVAIEVRNPLASGAREAPLTPHETRCDPSLPVMVELLPINDPVAGQPVRFELKVDVRLDPDIVRAMRVEYDLSPRIRMQGTSKRQELRIRTGRYSMELGIIVPDETRYAIRARLVVDLIHGKTLSTSAVRWIDLGTEDPPEGMIGRIINTDGTGIRVYQGKTVRK